MRMIANTILSACVDRDTFKRSEKYVEGNRELAIKFLNLMIGVKEYLSKKIKIKFESLEKEVIAPVDTDTDGLIDELDNSNRHHALAKAILGEISRQGYNRLKDKLENDKHFTDFPSFCSMTKNLLKVVAFTLDANLNSTNNATKNDVEEDETQRMIMTHSIILTIYY